MDDALDVVAVTTASCADHTHAHHPDTMLPLQM